MESTVRIAIVGDYRVDEVTHRAIDDALRHVIGARHRAIVREWVPTAMLAIEPLSLLGGMDAIWIAPGPYANNDGVTAAIRQARDRDLPLLATCDGFDQVIYAVRDEIAAQSGAAASIPSFDPGAPQDDEAESSRAAVIFLDSASRSASVYGRWRLLEGQVCRKARGAAALAELERRGSALWVSGHNETGEARVIELRKHSFFIATLFEPQFSSTAGSPAPLVRALVDAAIQRRGRRGGGRGTPNGMRAIAAGV